MTLKMFIWLDHLLHLCFLFSGPSEFSHAATDTYLVCDGYKCYALSSAPHQLFVLYTSAIPTFAMRSATHTDRQTDILMDRQTDRLMDRQTDGRTDGHTHRQTDLLGLFRQLETQTTVKSSSR